VGGFVTSGWFDATAATFLMGHGPKRSSGTPLPVVINAALASTLSDAGPGVLGTELHVPDRVRRGFQSALVVGVVANTLVSVDGQPVPMLFLPMPPDAPPALTLVSRVREAAAGRHAIEAAVHAADPVVPVGRIESIEVRIGELSRGFRDAAWFVLALGVLALGLAAAGLHSLLSYTVRRRTREIGIRVAIGADARDVVWLVLKPGLWLVLIGACAGLATAVALATVLRSELFGISPLDLGALLPSVGVLLLVSLAASALPAYRAARVNPVEALRHE
jgi:hypothetical protein